VGRGPGTIELTGAPRKLAFPQACASCGTPAGRRIPIEKVFERQRGDHPSRYAVVRVDVPFCTTCRQRHHDEAKHLPAGQQALSVLRSILLIPATVFVIMAMVLIGPFVHRVAIGNWKAALVFFGLVVGFALLGILCGWAALRRSHRYRVTEQTSVTSAFDFSDDLSQAFERERHSYLLRNPRFAEAFVAVNASRVSDNQGRSARAGGSGGAGRGRSAVLWAGLAGTLVFVSWILAVAFR
jgi:hypothetical protein